MRDRRPWLVLPSVFAVWALSGCGGPADVIVLARAAGGPEQGGVLVALSPTAPSFDDEQELLVAEGGSPSEVLQLWIDGRPVMLDDGAGHLSRVTVSEGGSSAMGYLDAGPRHFSVTTLGGAPIFEGDAEVPSDGTLRLFLFGPAGAQQGRFVAAPAAPAAGNEHLTLLNLVRTGQALQVVSCRDAATCTALSPALALGELFDTEVPASSGDVASTFSAGSGVGYRVVPSPSLPDPPVAAFHRAPTAGESPPPVFIAAPVYMSDEGQPQYGFN